MKRFLSVLLIGVLIFSITGCSSSKPETAVTGYLGSLKKGDYEEMAKYIKSDSEKITDDIFSKEDEKTDVALKKAYSKLEYNVVSSEVDGDKAVVETDINVPNLGSVMTDIMKEAIPLALANAFSEESNDDDMDKLTDNMLIDKLNSDDIPMVKKTVKINLYKFY